MSSNTRKEESKKSAKNITSVLRAISGEINKCNLSFSIHFMYENRSCAISWTRWVFYTQEVECSIIRLQRLPIWQWKPRE